MIGFIGLENGVKVIKPITADVESIRNNYFTTEIDTGTKWIDGKPIYRKVIDFGALPNNATKAVAHNISNLGWVVKLSGMSRRDISTIITLPFNAVDNISKQIILRISNTAVICITGSDRTDFVDTFVIVEYTKTTD